MATHSSIFALRILWTEQSMGCKESDTTERLTHTGYTERYVCRFPPLLLFKKGLQFIINAQIQ